MSRGATRRRRGSRGPFTLASLHPDLLALIVDHLDRASAVSLAQTCSPIQPIAERAVWKELNISVHRTFMPGSTSWNTHRPLGGNRLFAIREEHIWGSIRPVDAAPSGPSRIGEDALATVDGPAPPATDETTSLQRYYLDLLSHLQGDPQRFKSVRAIFIDLDRLLHPLVADLLLLVAPTLHSLHFNPPGFPFEPSPAFPSLSPRDIVDILEGSFSFDNLRTLHLPLGHEWSETISTVLPATRNLRKLTIAVEQPYSGSWGTTNDFSPVCNPIDGWPVLRHLEELCVEEMALAFEGFVAALIEGSSRVTRITIGDPAQTWRLQASDEIVDVLAHAAGLRYLACPRSALLRNVTGQYRDVEELSVTQERPPWGRPALESVWIPPLPGLKSLYSYARVNEARSISLAWTGESRRILPSIHPISHAILQSIHTASSLLFVQQPGSPTREFGLPTSDSEWDYWGSKASARNHDRAVLIRTYEHDPTDEVFTHCRSYSAHHSHIEDGIVHRYEEVWEEHVDYMGACPPAGVLGETYGAMAGGSEAGWKVPKRGARMCEEAWNVLRRWRAEHGGAAEPVAVTDQGGGGGSFADEAE